MFNIPMDENNRLVHLINVLLFLNTFQKEIVIIKEAVILENI